MLWHDQKNGLPETKLWDDCGAAMRRSGPADSYVTGCARPHEHAGAHSVYACPMCGGLLNVDPDLRDDRTGDTTRAQAAHTCDDPPHKLSIAGRARAVHAEADARLFEARVDPWALRGEVDGSAPRHDPYFYPSEAPAFLGRFDALDVWATRDRFHAVVEEGTGFGWPRATHRNTSHTHRSFMLKTIRNSTGTATKVWLDEDGFRTQPDIGPASDLLDQIEAAIDVWLSRVGTETST